VGFRNGLTLQTPLAWGTYASKPA